VLVTTIVVGTEICVDVNIVGLEGVGEVEV